MQDQLGASEKERRLIRHIYHRSGIETRYSVLPDFKPGYKSPMFESGSEPLTGERNDIYKKEGVKLFTDIAHRLLNKGRFDADEITHIITVSCTGFFAPGPDFEIAKSLKLNPDIRRVHLGFMGCYASVPALQLAKTFTAHDPDAVVMIVSAELCTLHFQNRTATDDLLSTAVFADGAAGVIVSSCEDRSALFELSGFHSEILERGEEDMAWTIGNHGFEMVLTTYIPHLIQDQLMPFLAPALRRYGLNSTADVDRWAVHPGGRAILDHVSSSLGLHPDALSPSRSVLAKYGNMSSATLLFVLHEISKTKAGSKAGSEEKTLAMAFGPGLTLESALLTRLPASV